MLIGYNNDVQYRGKVFHIQTEDRGSPAMQIETQIFHAGAILDTRIVSYEEMIAAEQDQEARNRSIKMLMQKTHKELYRNLYSGGYDHFVGLEPVEKVEEVVEEPEDFTPSQERIPDAARALEESGELADELKAAAGGDHIDLQSLKSRLARMNATPSEVVADPSEVSLSPASSVAKPADAGGSGVLKPVLSLNKKPARVTKPTFSAPTKNAQTSRDSVDSWPQTGVQVWQGCEPSPADLSILNLVESLL